MQVKIKMLHGGAWLPLYKTDGAACFDLKNADDSGCVRIGSDKDCEPSHIFGTGLSFEIPEGYVMLVFSRSGHGFDNSARLANCVGVIDSDYRGELKIKLTADFGGYLEIDHGDRIAQAMIVPIPRVAFQPVDTLSDTARGAAGFGSTGR